MEDYERIPLLDLLLFYLFRDIFERIPDCCCASPSTSIVLLLFNRLKFEVEEEDNGIYIEEDNEDLTVIVVGLI